MDNKTIIGYDILAKRAIETESGINIDDALNRITAFRVVRGEGEDHHPASDVTVSTKILYYTKTDKGYIAWIWVDGEGWVSAGGVSNESWKAWSEEHGSSATNEDSVYIGENLSAEGDFPSYQFGHDNVVDGEVPEFVEPQEIVSMNIGAMNTVHGEGINIGKKNTTDTFGITIGQRNVSHGAGIAIGEDLTVDNGSIGIGKWMRLESGSYAIGSNSTDFRVGYGSHLFGSNNSGLLDNGSYLFGGQNNLQSVYGSIIVGLSNQIVYNALGGISIFGCNNIIGNGDYPSGSVALGNYNDIKGSSSVSLGIAAGSKNCSIAISAKGTNSQLGSFADTGSIAIGNRGVYAYDGSTSIGTDGVAAHYHGISIGHGGVHAYNYSFAFGESVTAHSYSMALGMDGCYAFEQSISVGRSGSTALDRSMVFGRDGVFAWNRGIAIGHTGVEAITDAIAIGTQNVKGQKSSVAIGRAGVYAYDASVAFGNGGYAAYGSMSLLNCPNKDRFTYKTQNWNGLEKLALFRFMSKDGSSGYVDVKLTGIQFSGYDFIETSTGNQYSQLRYFPFNNLGVAIRGHLDERGNIVPFYIPLGSETETVEIPQDDTWINVSWGSSYNDTVSVVYGISPTNVGYGADGGSFILGNGIACARGGSLAISKRPQYDNGDFRYNVSNADSNSITISVRDGYLNGNAIIPVSVYSASADNTSLSIGTGAISNDGSTAIGVNSLADRGSLAIGYGLWSGDISFGRAIDDSLLISSIGYPSDGVRTRGESGATSIAIGSGPIATGASQSIGICPVARNKSVSLGYYSRSTNESIAIGDDNEAGLNAFAIGTKNLSYGWSILYGVDNKTPRESGAHATIIGYNNTSTSNIEKLEKTIRVKYDKQTALSKLAERYTVIHNAQLNLGSPYMTSSELNRVMSYESALYDYCANGGTYPSYDSEYAAIKTALFSKPMISMDASTWDSWNNLYTYGVYYIENALYYLESYGPSDSSYTSCRDYVYTYAPAFVDIMISYATDHMPSRYLSALIVAKTTLENRPEIIPSSLFNEQSKYMEIVNLFLDSYRNKDYSYTGSMPTESQFTYYTYETELNKLLNNMYSIRTGSDETVYIDEIEEAICNSVIFGANNTSNHYNSILVGTKNQSLSPVIESADTDDDGFMLAIGFKNTVGRNYDIAIGYMSTANGGENVALQHSEAEGYRNFAAFDSKVRGTANVLLGESTLLIPWDGDTSENINKLNAATHNLMFNSLAENITQPIGRYMQNVLLDVDLATDAQSVTENFIYGGAGYNNDTKVELTAGSSVTGNVILGGQHGSNQLKITCTNAIIDNIISHPSSIIANASYAFHRNILIGQGQIDGEIAPVLDINSSETVIKNIVIHGSIAGQARTFNNNIVLSDSKIESTFDQDDGGCVNKNILLNNAKLVNTDVKTWWAGSYRQPCTDNIVVGANVSDSINSVIISDSNAGAQISDALRIFNFGDNFAMHVAEGRVFGGYNTIQCAKKFFISGDQNRVVSTAESMGTTNGANSFTTIFGSDNTVTSIPDAVENARNTLFGCQNAIRGSGVGDNSIFGSRNQIGSADTDYNITECFVSGSDNLISSRVNAFTILGKSNSVHCNGGTSDNKLWAIGNGFVQGNNNLVDFGSNTIAMGNGNIVGGHNSVAIGCQLISNQWQTVIGKYNQPVDGPDRLTSADDPSQSNKALFIVGNGYSTKDDRDWKDEQFITRSNAMVVYANGDTVFSGNVNAANLPPAPSNDGRYALNCIVTNGVPSYSWVPVGTVTV